MINASHERPHIVWFRLYEITKLGKSRESESRLITVGYWKEEWRVAANGNRFSF